MNLILKTMFKKYNLLHTVLIWGKRKNISQQIDLGPGKTAHGIKVYLVARQNKWQQLPLKKMKTVEAQNIFIQLKTPTLKWHNVPCTVVNEFSPLEA